MGRREVGWISTPAGHGGDLEHAVLQLSLLYILGVGFVGHGHVAFFMRN